MRRHDLIAYTLFSFHLFAGQNVLVVCIRWIRWSPLTLATTFHVEPGASGWNVIFIQLDGMHYFRRRTKSKSHCTAKTQQSAQTNLHLNVTRSVAVVAFFIEISIERLTMQYTHAYIQTIHAIANAIIIVVIIFDVGVTGELTASNNNEKIRMKTKRKTLVRDGVGLLEFFFLTNFLQFSIYSAWVSSFSLSANVDVRLLLLHTPDFAQTTNCVYLLVGLTFASLSFMSSVCVCVWCFTT